MSGELTVETVFARTYKVLATARQGLDDLQGSDVRRRMSGLHNVIAFGRSVTIVLQNLRTVIRDDFDKWYGPLQKELGEDPPGASDFFIGDEVGGSGWIVELPDGTTGKYYVDLPDRVGLQSRMTLPDVPSELGTDSATELAARYLERLQAIVQDARRQFLPNA